MAGRFRNLPNDDNTFRQEYMSVLALQSKIDDLNLQANLLYKKTGVTPTQPIDTRLTIEKLADVERLKQEVRSGLREIADGQQSQQIVQTLTAEELVFVSQHMPQIILDIKPRYRYGVLADIFVPYIRSLITKDMTNNQVAVGMPPIAVEPGRLVVTAAFHPIIELCQGYSQFLPGLIGQLDRIEKRYGLLGAGGNDLDKTNADVVDSINAVVRNFDRILQSIPSEQVFNNIVNSNITHKQAAFGILGEVFQYAPDRPIINAFANNVAALSRRRGVSNEEVCMLFDDFNVHSLQTFIDHLPAVRKMNGMFGDDRDYNAPPESVAAPPRAASIRAADMFTEEQRVAAAEQCMHKGTITEKILLDNFVSSSDAIHHTNKEIVTYVTTILVDVVYVIFPNRIVTSLNFRPDGGSRPMSKEKKEYLIETLRTINVFLQPIYDHYGLADRTYGPNGP